MFLQKPENIDVLVVFKNGIQSGVVPGDIRNTNRLPEHVTTLFQFHIDDGRLLEYVLVAIVLPWPCFITVK